MFGQPGEDPIVNPKPNRYECYFMVCPSPTDSTTGFFDVDTEKPFFFVKFGDGVWHGHRYTTHNPSFMPGNNNDFANSPGLVHYYLTGNGNNAVNPGTWLEYNLLNARFSRYINGEWYKVHCENTAEAAEALAADLKTISDTMDNNGGGPVQDFGYDAAVTSWNNGETVLQQQTAATAALTQIAIAFNEVLQKYT